VISRRTLGKKTELLASISCAAFACLLLTSTAHAQALLRGTVDDDPILRVGRTASEQQRNVVTPTGTRAAGAPPLRQTTRRRVSAQPAENGASRRQDSAASEEAAGTQATSERAARPRQQNFRSFERPINSAVPQPSGEQLVYQGLPQNAPVRRRGVSNANPYDPIGLRLGTFTVLPTADILMGYDTNPLSTPSGQPKKGAAFVRTELGLQARSDWAAHELTADIRGGYSKFTGIKGADRPDAQARVGLRLDYTRDTAFDFELRGRIDSETPGTVNLTGGASERPLTFQSGATAGVTQRFNRLAVSARATFDRSTFSDTTLSTGGTLNQQGRNFNQYGLRLRAGYEVTPGFVPFVEAVIDQRRRDNTVDSSGFKRDSSGLQVRAGTSLEFTRTVTGEIVAGYGQRKYEDGRLADLRGPIVEGSLSWAVSPLTTLRLRGTSEFEETTLANSSGSITRRISADVSHALLRNLVINGGINFSKASFQGTSRTEDTFRATLGVDYSLSPNLVLRGSYINSRTISNVTSGSSASNVFLFGARLQF
jgi:hypothetical protein